MTSSSVDLAWSPLDGAAVAGFPEDVFGGRCRLPRQSLDPGARHRRSRLARVALSSRSTNNGLHLGVEL